MTPWLNAFTKQYELQKTLRFSIIPQADTLKYIKEHEVIRKDEIIYQAYKRIKFYLDLLHKIFIQETLKHITLDTKQYYKAYVAVFESKEKTAEKSLIQEEKKLLEQIGNAWSKTAQQWKKRYHQIQLKEHSYTILTEERVLELLYVIFPKEPSPDAPPLTITLPDGNEENIFQLFKGFFTYLKEYNQSRKNFYSIEEKESSIAYRIVYDNLRIYSKNCSQYAKRQEEYNSKDINLKELNEIFEPENYSQFLTQEGIDKYNSCIGSDPLIHEGINQKINAYRQKTKSELPFFKTLHNQILGKDTAQKTGEIHSDQDVFSFVRDCVAHDRQKLKQAKTCFLKLFSKETDLEQAYITKSALNTISQKWFGAWNFFSDFFTKEKHVSLGKVLNVLEHYDQNITKEEKDHVITGSLRQLIPLSLKEAFLEQLKREEQAILEKIQLAQEHLVSLMENEQSFKKEQRHSSQQGQEENTAGP
jgi:CRISPR-associated protein Cpf1